MTYTRPFVTSRFTAHEGDSWRRQLSLAVQVVDAFTGGLAAVPLRVYLKELRFLPTIRSQGGFFCFEGNLPGQSLPPGDYTLVVEPEPTTADFFYLQPRPGAEWSAGFERTVTLPLTDPRAPVEVVTLSPKPSYPFPANATLLRGKVTQGLAAVGVGGAVVSSTYEQVDAGDSDATVFVDIETQTDSTGEYVLFFKSLPARTQPITVLAVKDGQSAEQDITITEGATLIADPLEFP